MIEIIIKPIISEKMTAITEKCPQRYAFQVTPEANKIQIKNAVEKLYGVNVVSVNTMNVLPKVQSRWTRAGLIQGRKSQYKKAVVTLKKGETIDFFSHI